MTIRHLAAFAAAAGLALAPMASDAHMLVIPGCGSARQLTVIPVRNGAPGKQGDGCAKACHAVTERRGKGTETKRNCC